jgi:hypothetical protein
MGLCQRVLPPTTQATNGGDAMTFGVRPPEALHELIAAHGPDLAGLCDACVAHLPGVSGAGLAVMTTMPAWGTRYTSDAVSAQIEELQFVLGEGPCVDAFTQGQPELASDLAADESAQRWPAFAPAAVAAGARALFAIPLQVGAAKVGVIDLYRDRPGGLNPQELADALVFADAATLMLIFDARPGHAEGSDGLTPVHRAVVHQATGMVMAQLNGTINEAFARLRAYAFAQNRPLAEIADDVVSRRLRFDTFTD